MMQRADAITTRMAGVVGAVRWMRCGRAMACVVGFCLLTGLFAQVRIPIPGTVVPMTLQSTAVLLTGYCLSVPLAMAAMVLYVAAGLAGVPVFAPGSLGLAGVTGGYIVGFVLGAAVVALLRGRSHGIVRLLLAGMGGTAVILVCGVLWQTIFFDVSYAEAWAGGVWPFVPKAAVQLFVAVAAVRAMARGRRPSERTV